MTDPLGPTQLTQEEPLMATARPNHADSSYYKAPEMSVSLAGWLDQARQWHIEYGGYLSNHLTHNWVVMGAAHAPDERFRWWHDLYMHKLEQSPAREPGPLEPCRTCTPGEAITEETWLTCIEREREGFAGYRDFFDARISENGVSAVLRKYLPPLLPGLAGAALHPLIHTGWGMDANHEHMLADGLAYMATAFQPLATEAPHTPPTELWSPDGLTPIAATLAYLTKAREQGLSEISDEASKTEEYLSLERGYFQHRIITFDDSELPLGASLNEAGPLGLPALDEPLLPAIEECVVLLSAALRASKNEFFVLHGLTSLHAVLTLIPHLGAKDQRDAITHWWRAVMATLVSQDFPELERTVETVQGWVDGREAGQEQSPPQVDDEKRAWWRERLTSTLGSLDEHVPKAVYVFWRWSEWGVFGQDTVKLFEASAHDISQPHPGGEVDQHLWFSRASTH